MTGTNGHGFTPPTPQPGVQFLVTVGDPPRPIAGLIMDGTPIEKAVCENYPEANRIYESISAEHKPRIWQLWTGSLA